jgi:arylsulfatase A-like enzyme
MAAAPGRPNVLFLMTGQRRMDALGANGNKLIRTPNLDRLANRGANFSHAFVQSPVCVPSRVSQFTGRYPHSHKNRVNYTPCDPREVFLQRRFKDAGYATGAVGKLHYYPATNAHARSTGWDEVALDDGVAHTDPFSDYVKWRRRNDPKANVPYHSTAPGGKNPFRAAVDYEFTPAAWTGSETRVMMRRLASKSKPFFLFSSFFKPHAPHTVPVPFDSLYDDVEIPLPAPVTRAEIERLPLPVQKLVLRGRPRFDMDRTLLQWTWRSYYAGVSMVDREIGLIVEELEKTGQASNTIIVFSCDHGDQLLEHGFEGKNAFFESSVRIPFFIAWHQVTVISLSLIMMAHVDNN